MLKLMQMESLRLTTLINKDDNHSNWSQELKNFNANLTNLQHERLIHLLVTITVGISTLISCLITLLKPILPLYLLDIILGILFLAYILHYRKLENATQSYYQLLLNLQRKATSN